MTAYAQSAAKQFRDGTLRNIGSWHARTVQKLALRTTVLLSWRVDVGLRLCKDELRVSSWRRYVNRTACMVSGFRDASSSRRREILKGCCMLTFRLPAPCNLRYKTIGAWPCPQRHNIMLVARKAPSAVRNSVDSHPADRAPCTSRRWQRAASQ